MRNFVRMALIAEVVGAGSPAAGFRAENPEVAIWIEAEQPSADNFPATKDNTSWPKEFWETGVLSGGNRNGKKWTEDVAQHDGILVFKAPSYKAVSEFLKVGGEIALNGVEK